MPKAMPSQKIVLLACYHTKRLGPPRLRLGRLGARQRVIARLPPSAFSNLGLWYPFFLCSRVEATSQQNLYVLFILPSLIYKLLRSGAWRRALSRDGAWRRALGCGGQGPEELCIRGWRDRRSYPLHCCLTGHMITKACDSIFRPNSHSAVAHSAHSPRLGVDGSLMLAQLETARSRWRKGYHVEEDAGTPTKCGFSELAGRRPMASRCSNAMLKQQHTRLYSFFLKITPRSICKPFFHYQ